VAAELSGRETATGECGVKVMLSGGTGRSGSNLTSSNSSGHRRHKCHLFHRRAPRDPAQPRVASGSGWRQWEMRRGNSRRHRRGRGGDWRLARPRGTLHSTVHYSNPTGRTGGHRPSSSRLPRPGPRHGPRGKQWGLAGPWPWTSRQAGRPRVSDHAVGGSVFIAANSALPLPCFLHCSRNTDDAVWSSLPPLVYLRDVRATISIYSRWLR